MHCGNCGHETDRRPGELCPVCSSTLGTVQTPATPESTVQGVGTMLRGVGRARSRSKVVGVGAPLILLVLAATGGVAIYSVLQQADWRPTANLIIPSAMLLLALGLGWRWYR